MRSQGRRGHAMEKPQALVFLAVLLVAPLAAAAGWLANDYSEPDAIKVIPEVKVYKNGELVYHKIGDPPTDNLAMLWILMVAPETDVNGANVAIALTDVTGAADTYYPANLAITIDPALWVAIGTGTAAPSYQDTSLQWAGAAKAQLVSLTWDATNTAWVMQITGAITVGSAVTISEVGLIAELNENDPTTDPTVETDAYLVFRDVLSQSISAVAGDVIEVQYTITIDFP